MVDAEVARNRACAVARQQPATPLLTLVIAELRLSAEACPTPSGGRSALIGTADDALALVLGQGTQERDEAPTDGRREVEVAPVQDFDERAARVHAFDNGDAIKHRPRGSIPFCQHEGVAFLELVDGLFELWPLPDVSSARLLSEDFGAPLGSQGRYLTIQMLMRC